MINNYWNRQNRNLEDELFEMVGTYGTKDEMFNVSNDYKKTARLKRYAKLKSFIDSLTEEEIASNIFLKSANSFMKTSTKDCSIILDELNETISSGNESNTITVNCDIPDETQELIPEYIDNTKSIKYYRPEWYQEECINVLNYNYMKVYRDYNDCVSKIGKIAEDIYFLNLNNVLATLSTDLMCYHFQVYHPGKNNHFIASFAVNNKEANKIDMAILNEQTDGKVLKKTINN